MNARAAAAEETADRILDAALARYATLPYDRIRIEDVAADAEVTGQTVIRRFGGKAGLIVALVERELRRIAAAREAGHGSGPRELLHELVAHYERYGELILKMYSEAPLIDGLPELADRGRAFHVQWCRQAFVRQLAELPDDAAQRRLAEVIAVCDATTWRILRKDGALDPGQVELALGELMDAALAAADGSR